MPAITNPCVLEVGPFEDEDESPFVGLVQVELACVWHYAGGLILAKREGVRLATPAAVLQRGVLLVSFDDSRQRGELLLRSVNQQEADGEVDFGISRPSRVDRPLKPGTDNLVEDLECLTQSHLASTGKGELWFPLLRRMRFRETGDASSCARGKERDFR